MFINSKSIKNYLIHRRLMITSAIICAMVAALLSFFLILSEKSYSVSLRFTSSSPVLKAVISDVGFQLYQTNRLAPIPKSKQCQIERNTVEVVTAIQGIYLYKADFRMGESSSVDMCFETLEASLSNFMEFFRSYQMSEEEYKGFIERILSSSLSHSDAKLSDSSIYLGLQVIIDRFKPLPRINRIDLPFEVQSTSSISLFLKYLLVIWAALSLLSFIVIRRNRSDSESRAR